ncbi:cytochrome P450 77A3-like [Cucumis melo var. makuwa]|uniref:Cytochrome P450 77A3-like n=1 Tax=Cucumis melo var. makuwa TaxID=1194695 RepID=A0A5A7U0H3_CUCMM|nr:cytochrome P450 77A3-like [Cucumis melo var. makuwa]
MAATGESELVVELINRRRRELENLASDEFLKGGTNTTKTVIEWGMAELIANEEVQRNIVEEIKETVCERKVEGVLLTLSIRVVPAWVSSEITTYLGLRHQHVLGAPPGHRRPDFRSYGSACCTCSETCQRLGEGKGRGKLASDREGSVTCHMRTQFCFRIYVLVF